MDWLFIRKSVCLVALKLQLERTSMKDAFLKLNAVIQSLW